MFLPPVLNLGDLADLLLLHMFPLLPPPPLYPQDGLQLFGVPERSELSWRWNVADVQAALIALVQTIRLLLWLTQWVRLAAFRRGEKRVVGVSRFPCGGGHGHEGVLQRCTACDESTERSRRVGPFMAESVRKPISLPCSVVYCG